MLIVPAAAGPTRKIFRVSLGGLIHARVPLEKESRKNGTDILPKVPLSDSRSVVPQIKRINDRRRASR